MLSMSIRDKMSVSKRGVFASLRMLHRGVSCLRMPAAMPGASCHTSVSLASLSLSHPLLPTPTLPHPGRPAAAKAYVDAQDGFHSTPLHLAAERGREAAVQLLLGACALAYTIAY